MPTETVESRRERPGDTLWSAWLLGVVLAAFVLRLAPSRTPWIEWLERAILPLMGFR